MAGDFPARLCDFAERLWLATFADLCDYGAAAELPGEVRRLFLSLSGPEAAALPGQIGREPGPLVKRCSRSGRGRSICRGRCWWSRSGREFSCLFNVRKSVLFQTVKTFKKKLDKFSRKRLTIKKTLDIIQSSRKRLIAL